MRLVFTFNSDKPIKIPLQYNHIVQALLLSWLSDENYKLFIHDIGYSFNNRNFKLFTFSKLEGKFNINKRQGIITFYDEVKLHIASYDDKFLPYLVEGFLKSDYIELGCNQLHITDIFCEKEQLKSEDTIYTKSPITVYSTFVADKKKKTYYYSPFESEFSEMIKNNLIKKYNIIYGQPPTIEESYFKLIPVKNNKLRESIIIYKGTVIKGWNGEFIIIGSKEMLNIAYNTGLGAKNSQGFGCIKLLNRR